MIKSGGEKNESGKVGRREGGRFFPIVGLIVALLLSVSVGADSALAQTQDEVVQAVEKHYREVTDLTARVVQKNFLKAVGKTQKFEGTLSIKKPGKLRLDYTNGQLIVIDGKEAWFYSKKSEQAIRRTFTDFEHANIPVAFLLGAGDIRSDFTILRPDAGKARVLELLPKKPGAAMKKLGITADAAGRITEMVIHDKSGNTSTVVFSDLQEDAGLADKLFQFKAPKGTEIIEQ